MGHTHKSQLLALSQRYTSITHSLSSFPFLPSCLPAFPDILKLLAELKFTPSAGSHIEDKRRQIFVLIAL